MKKAFFAVIPTLALASCSFWNAPVEEFFSYWASEAFVRDSSVKGLKQNDGAGVISVASNKNAEVILNVTNPKNFRLVMPSVGNSDMIHFGAFDSQPAAGTDYTLEQISGDTLKLTYTSQFLKKHEWGQKDLGASLTLFADDGRKFNRPYAFSIKSNTRPPETSVVLAQTTESTPHYVLCLTVSDMDTQVNGEKLHKDIAQIVINGAAFPLAINSTGSDFVKPADGSFIERTAVTQLTAPGSEAVPTAAWTLFYKTGVPTGGAYTAYTITLRDEKGLISEKLETGTTINKPAEETVTLTAGVQDSGSGTAALPFIIAPAGTPPEAQISVQCATSGTTVHCAVTDVNAGTATEYNGNPVTVPLPLNGKNEKLYEVKYNTKGTGYNPTTLKTKYYKILKRHTITFSANGGKFADDSTAKTAAVLHGRMITAPSVPPAQDGFTFLGWYKEGAGTTAWDFTNDAVMGDTTLYAKWSRYAVVIKPNNPAEAWKKLKEEAAKASGVNIIVIDGEIKATTDSGNNGEITIGRNLTIQGKNSAASDILNANGGTFSVSDSHRIFKVTGGKTLTLKNLTLKGGKTTGTGDAGKGGAIYVRGAAVDIANCILNGNKAEGGTDNQGGAIYAHGATVNIKNCTMTGNAATKDGGAVYADKDTAASTITISGGTIGGAGTDANLVTDADGFGGGIFINDGCTLTLDEYEGQGVKIIGNKAGRAGGVRANKSTVSMTGCTIRGNKAKSTSDNGGGGVYIQGGTLNMSRCTITGNEAEKNGGGLNIEKGTVTMTNCTITGNEAKTDGGGIYTSKLDGTACTVTIRGGTIGGAGTDANKATGTGSNGNGGGIYVGTDCTVTLEDSTDGGVKILGNTAAKGGGVYISSMNAKFTMNGRAVVTPSTGGDKNVQGKNDVYFVTGSGIDLTGTLSPEGGIAARITPDNYNSGTQVLRGSTVSKNYIKFVVTPNGSQYWLVDGTGALTME